jgi:hypothetical protein
MDTTRTKRDPGWVPRFTALEALRDTLRPGPPALKTQCSAL